jgi:hypothetical protein
MNLVAKINFSMAKYEIASKLHSEVYHIKNELYGSNHFETLDSLNEVNHLLTYTINIKKN